MSQVSQVSQVLQNVLEMDYFEEFPLPPLVYAFVVVVTPSKANTFVRIFSLLDVYQRTNELEVKVHTTTHPGSRKQIHYVQFEKQSNNSGIYYVALDLFYFLMHNNTMGVTDAKHHRDTLLTDGRTMTFIPPVEHRVESSVIGALPKGDRCFRGIPADAFTVVIPSIAYTDFETVVDKLGKVIDRLPIEVVAVPRYFSPDVVYIAIFTPFAGSSDHRKVYEVIELFMDNRSIGTVQDAQSYIDKVWDTHLLRRKYVPPLDVYQPHSPDDIIKTINAWLEEDESRVNPEAWVIQHDPASLANIPRYRRLPPSA